VSDARRPRDDRDLTRRGFLPGGRAVEHGPLDPTVVDAKRAVTPGTARLAEELAPGSRINHYEIIRELGRGGMARVVVARDLKLGRKVALKVLDSDSSEFTARFLVEARATARCSHENIVIIHEVDEFQGTPYMVLELLDGQSLASFLAAGTVSPRRAVEIVVPVVAALVHAHALDIVHRDLKPDNIFVTARGGIKVLDFGIAKLFTGGDGPGRPDNPGMLGAGPALSGFAGTMPYMAPEQWGVHEIDHRADIWAVGIILWQLLAGRHPLDPLTREKLFAMAAAPDEPMPSIATAIPSLPSELERIVDRCLAKRVEGRHASARELLEALLKLMPGHGRSLSEHESPYLGLRAFQESDADRFYGRSGDVRHFIERIRELPLVGVVGPSGVGKSSFVQAGIVPALRGSSDEWEVLVVRPGRDPLASLAALIDPASATGPERGEPAVPLHERLREEPGYLGVALRRRAQRKGARVLLFVDQFEELYALVGDAALRQAFTACVAGVADDWSSPLRVVLSMRSDFVDRVAEDRVFMQQLARGLVFLPPPDRDGLREALIQPLDAVGFRFEDPTIAEEMIDSLLGTPGALPLLQFASSKLWEARDRERRLITRASYEAVGGVAGALAGHADQVLASMAPPTQRIVRAIFQRLVTAEGTRAIAHIAELAGIAAEPRDVEGAIDLLVGARLLVQSRGERAEPAVEIVHEALIQGWPTLRRWLDERHEDSAYLEHVRNAARQWEDKGRPGWLLWTGEPSEEARRFSRRYKGELGALEQEYLAAVLQRATRAARRRRGFLVAAFAFLVALVAAAGIALLAIQNAERVAREQRQVAEGEARRARAAEHTVKEQLVLVREKDQARLAAERERQSAESAASQARTEVVAGREQLAQTNLQLEAALTRARREAERSAALARAERAAKEKLGSLLERERERVKQLQEQRRKISTELK
jgi:eukaryotic-like serine/threonine-protein kinase